MEEEINECAYWLELLQEGNLVPRERIAPLHAEANELTAIIVASINSAKQRRAGPP